MTKVWGMECDGTQNVHDGTWTSFVTRDEHLIFDLHMGLEHNASWFTAQLFRFFGKADQNNLERFRLGFPDEVRLFEAARRGEL